MKRINLVIGVALGIILAIILLIIFCPIFWLLGANNVYEKTHKFLDNILFDYTD